MRTEWTEAPLGHFIELKRGYDLPTRDREEGPYPIVSSSGVTGRHREAKVAGPGVITGRYGTIGEVFYLEGNFWPLNTTLYVRDFKGNDPRFVSYFLRTIDFTAFTDKAAVPGVNRNHLHGLPVRFPPVHEQRRIAEILDSLDDKIELNRRMNETLEATARAIFKSWFVDFDPVQGTAPVPDEVRRLFPDRLVDSPIGPVPEGWTVAPMGEHAEVVRGLSYAGAGLADEGMPLHNLNSVRPGGGYQCQGIKHYIGEYRERDLVRPGDVVVANTDLTQAANVIGYPAIVPRSFGEDGLFSQDLCRLRPLDASPLTPRFLYLLLASNRLHHEVASYGNGTTVIHLAMDGLRRPLVVSPPHDVIARFDEVITPMFDQQESLTNESKTLTHLRDALLPKLVTGALRLLASSPS